MTVEKIEDCLGIIGGGQLGRMLSMAAANLGINVTFVDPSQTAVTKHVAKQHLCSPFDDKQSLETLFSASKAVTFEFENVSVEALKNKAFTDKLSPNLDALYIANDRIREKEFFQQCGLQVAPYVGLTETSSLSDQQFLAKVSEAADSLGYPLIIKTCSMGYDGKGQISLSDCSSLGKALELKSSDRLVVEKRVSFSREVSALAVRNKKSEVLVYPTPENVHKDGILFSSIVTESEPIKELDQAIRAVVEKLDYVGVLAIEFFEVDGKFLVNEMAPRVHNTGHWTIEGTVSSQFENHVRAVMGMPLGSTDLRFPCAMLNIIGRLPDSGSILKIPGTHLHLYGKEPRAGRKLGHLTIEARTVAELQSRLDAAKALIF